MVKVRKHNLHAVEVDRQDLEKKLKAHRRKVSALVLASLLILGAVVLAAYFYFENKVYSSYEILSSFERTDTSASEFTVFQGKLLKYTNDGAVYTDLSGNLIWNQTYEMDQPMIETCGNYAAIYELNGTQIYILDTVNQQGSIQTTMPIQKVSIAAQGTVAILMENEGTSYLQLYDKKGNQLAAGELHVQNSGYPLNLALSESGEKLAVSMLDIHGGTLKTVIAFYNFGSVGQSSIDKIVSSYQYADIVIPQIRYLNNDIMVAFGDNRILLFTGTQKPAESRVIELQDEVKSIFYNETQFGLIYDGEDGKNHRLELYSHSGAKKLDFTFDTDYTKVGILTNGEIYIQGEDSCEIYNARGICRFQYQFGEHIYQILSGNMQNHYIFILEGKTQKVKLK